MSLWDSTHQGLNAALQQDWAYGASLQKIGVDVCRARVEINGEVVALAQFIIRKWGDWGGIALCSRGPLWLQPLPSETQAKVYQALKKSLPLRGLRFMTMTPEVAKGQSHGLSRWRRVMSGLSTVMLDLTPSLENLRAQLDRRWRHRLVTGESSDMKIHQVGTKHGQFRWLLDLDLQQQKEKNLQGLPSSFYEHYTQFRKTASESILTLRADLGKDRIAAMMFLIHGRAATYQVGWTLDQGRDSHAHNLILWKGIEELQARGVQMLDLGGVNTARSAGIARFKLSTGGQLLTLSGTYF